MTVLKSTVEANVLFFCQRVTAKEGAPKALITTQGLCLTAHNVSTLKAGCVVPAPASLTCPVDPSDFPFWTLRWSHYLVRNNSVIPASRLQEEQPAQPERRLWDDGQRFKDEEAPVWFSFTDWAFSLAWDCSKKEEFKDNVWAIIFLFLFFFFSSEAGQLVGDRFYSRIWLDLSFYLFYWLLLFYIILYLCHFNIPQLEILLHDQERICAHFL